MVLDICKSLGRETSLRVWLLFMTGSGVVGIWPKFEFPSLFLFVPKTCTNSSYNLVTISLNTACTIKGLNYFFTIFAHFPEAKKLAGHDVSMRRIRTGTWDFCCIPNNTREHQPMCCAPLPKPCSHNPNFTCLRALFLCPRCSGLVCK